MTKSNQKIRLVRDTLSQNALVTVPKESKLVDLYPLLTRENNPDGIILVLEEDGTLAGIVTASNFLSMKKFGVGSTFQTILINGEYANTTHPIAKAAERAFRSETRAETVMTSKVITVTPETTQYQALAILAQHGFHRLPVVNEQQKVIGIFHQQGVLQEAANYVHAVEEAGLVSLTTPYVPEQNTPEALMMNRRLVIAHPDDPLVTLYEKLLLANNPDGIVLVMKSGRLVGVVTNSDLDGQLRTIGRTTKALTLNSQFADERLPMFFAVEFAISEKLTVGSVMKSPVTAKQSSSLIERLTILCEKEFQRLPILDKNNVVVSVFHQEEVMKRAVAALSAVKDS